MEPMLESYLSRYLAGDTRSVWDEIGSLSTAEMPSDFEADVSAVCRETMRRVRHNVEQIVSALESIEYEFGVYPDGNRFPLFEGPVAAPDPSIDRKLDELVGSVGAIPLALTALWREIGTICLIGRHPDWPSYADPLMIDPIDAALEEANTWHEMVRDLGADVTGSFRAPIAPDSFHKDNVSGGDWYGIELPCATVDAALSSEPHETTLVGYLHIAINANGFPGADQIPKPLADVEIDFLDF